MSTPPVLAKSYGNCAEYKPECIESRQKQLFYVALVFTAIGIAGHVASFDFFTEKQIKSILANVYGMLNNITQEDVDEDQHQDNRNLSPNATNFGLSSPSFPRLFLCIFCKCCGSFLFHFFSITIVVVGILVVVFVKPWGVRFGVSAIFAIFSFLVFLSAVCSYKYVGPRGSPFTTVFRVLFAASANMFYKQPLDVGELYENSSLGETTLLPHTNGLRCLDKAAIILPEPSLNQQEGSRWRLCRVTEIEATKIFIRIVPLWMTFILCGLISSLGDTYFMEQAENMKTELDPSLVFLFFNVLANILFSKLFEMIADEIVGTSSSRKRWVPPVGIAVAMVCSTLCCITAAMVERKRLEIVKLHNLLDKPDEKTPMSIFWLLPQFSLLGALDGILEASVIDILSDQFPAPMSRYSVHFALGASGIGYMVSPITVYLVGRISQKVTGENWFQTSFKKSRLDNYFWVLASLSAANLLVYVVVVSFYRFRESKKNVFDKPPAVLLRNNDPLGSFFAI